MTARQAGEADCPLCRYWVEPFPSTNRAIIVTGVNAHKSIKEEIWGRSYLGIKVNAIIEYIGGQE